MNRLSATASAAFAALAIIPSGALAQKLSPNAEILLTEQGFNGMRALHKASVTAAADTTLSTVSAYILSQDVNAMIPRLENLGVQVNSVYPTFVTAILPVSLLRTISELPEVDYLSMASPVLLKMDVARKDTQIDILHSNSEKLFQAPFTGKGVVVGVIDSGLEYDHIAFRDSNGNSRIRAVWNQNSKSGTPPEGFTYGVEITDPADLRAKAYDTASEFHGSHTTGIAAGGDRKSPYYGVATEADIVFVSMGDEDANIADGIKYIFDYADRVGKPCVINMSLGSHFGPHNGTSLLDQVIDSETGPGRIIVGACGNEGEFRLHCSETFTESDKQLKSMLTFNTVADHKIHMLEVWGDAGTDFSVRACVVESLKGKIAHLSDPAYTNAEEGPTSIIKVFDLAENSADATIIIKTEHLALNDQPHASVQIQDVNLPTGRMLGIVVDGQEGQTIHIWNASTHELSSNNKKGWTDGSVEYTVGEIGGTAKTIIPVGSYDSRKSFPAMVGGYWSCDDDVFSQDHKSTFSSVGPTADNRQSPMLLAPGMPVIAPYNSYYFSLSGADITYQASSRTIDSDNKSYYYGYNVGTSMSTPVVAGTIALMLEARPDLTPAEALKHLSSTTFTNDFMGSLPNSQYGYGRLNANAAMKSLLGLNSTEQIGMTPSEARVWAEGSMVNIYLAGADKGTTAQVYTASGVLVANLPLSGELTTVDASAWGHGIMIVSIPGAPAAKITL